ncbi:endolytic transglycosylase MltG [Inhella gelatinilytica]|uniref:Endolytic murein transglycosylase n=1 Tax=Inhella gelatinilytica TaxID=2795030 RepID=A0A931IVQ6_9BURK|nr:endolytic transglycosylase MltG [Inhella gelatinilytica]MBH9553044.1 endolytic transglycosylase MltG [Inhella gelatinilytica]
MLKRFVLFLLVLALLAGGLAAGAWQWWRSPLPLAQAEIELTIEPGRSVRGVADDWVAAGVQVSADWLVWAWRVSGQAPRIRAGSYLLVQGDSPERLLQKMVRGEETLESLRLIEGWTFAQARAALAQAPGLKQTLAGVPDAELMARLGLPGRAPEGQFFPDTYRYGRGVSDLFVLKQAHRALQRELERAWAERAADSVLKAPYDALILASIVEKETGRASDRPSISAVFHNRLRIGMPLQTDPTVIYGLGAQFDGNLRKRDLLADTPFNTYTRRGLPPTPIALVGKESLRAAVRPAASSALYFVARGDGSSEFSATLEAHNRAVQRFQLKK